MTALKWCTTLDTTVYFYIGILVIKIVCNKLEFAEHCVEPEESNWKNSTCKINFLRWYIGYLEKNNLCYNYVITNINLDLTT